MGKSKIAEKDDSFKEEDYIGYGSEKQIKKHDGKNKKMKEREDIYG